MRLPTFMSRSLADDRADCLDPIWRSRVGLMVCFNVYNFYAPIIGLRRAKGLFLLIHPSTLFGTYLELGTKSCVELRSVRHIHINH